MKKIITVLLSCIMLISLTGCAMFESKINDIKGNLVGNGYTIDTFDNYGKRVDRKSTRLNSSHKTESRMPSSA